MMRWSIPLVLSAALWAATAPARFREHTIASDLADGYQVLPVDLSGDGLTDLVVVPSRGDKVWWFEAPHWSRHLLVEGVEQPINAAVCTYDTKGRPEIVLAYGFSNYPRKSPGVVTVLRAGADVRGVWSSEIIDQLPTSHRLRCADFEGTGRKVVVNAPLAAETAEPPDYRGRVPLVFYRPGEWRRVVIGADAQGVVHGIEITDWDGDGRDEILVASFLGIHCYDYQAGQWRWQQITSGDPSPWPKGGTSDIAVGKLGKNKFIAAIEPWHGHQVVVYTPGHSEWRRQVIDNSFRDGHALLTSDLNRDGRDEIVAGYRTSDGRVYIYAATDPQGASWQRLPLDTELGPASCAAADLNRDDRPDIVCVGPAQRQLKWYENLGP